MTIKIKTNLCSGLIMGIIATWFLIILPEQVRLPAYNSGAPSPRIIPTIVLVGILICSAILIFQSLVLKKEKIYEYDIRKEAPAIILIGLMCLFAALIINLGFIAAVCIVFPLILFYMGERKPFIYIFSLTIGIGIFFLFKYIFNISLPIFPF